MYDLSWIATNTELWRTLDTSLIRRLSILKIWVDSNGLHSSTAEWRPAHARPIFDAKTWLRKRKEEEFDLEDIGSLAVPAPSGERLSEIVGRSYSFLLNMTADEKRLARASEKDRSLALKLLQELPGRRLHSIGIF